MKLYKDAVLLVEDERVAHVEALSKNADLPDFDQIFMR